MEQNKNFGFIPNPTVTCENHKYDPASGPPRTDCPTCRRLWDDAGKGRIVAVGKSKALSSGSALPLWQVPHSLREAAARRMLKGNEKGYPIHNWRGGLDDVEFLRDRYNHASKHMDMIGNGDFTIDDAEGNADAVVWFMCVYLEALRLHPTVVQAAFYNSPRNEKIGKDSE